MTRDSDLIRRRIACELVVATRTYKGFVRALSADAVFVELDTASLTREGVHAELRLSESAFCRALTLRCAIPRSAAMSTGNGDGLELRIIEAPIAYHEACLEAASGPAPGVPEPPARAVRPAAAPARTDTEAEHARASQGPTPRADAMLVYDGEALDDLYEVLEDIGVRPVRARLTGPTRFEGWTEPPKLFVILAKDALNTPWPSGALAHDVCRIAVTDSASGALGGLVSELGYDYLIRRPVPPEVLEMLFERALYSGEEARRTPRRPAARRVALRIGIRSHPATLVDISSGGARLLSRVDVELNESVALTLPGSGPHGRDLSLPGRVIRKRVKHHRGAVSLALRFSKEIEPHLLGEISRELANNPLGPAAEPPLPWIDRVGCWWRERMRRGPEVAVPTAEVEPLPPAPRPQRRPPEVPEAAERPERRDQGERRRTRRGQLDSEVVRLDPETAAMRSVLIGRDLSVDAMRIDPHPETRVGDRLTLALHDSADGPLILNGRLARDDGARGMLFEFEDLEPSVKVRLARLVEGLPAAPAGNGSRSDDQVDEATPGVESLGDEGPEGVVLARVVTEP